MDARGPQKHRRHFAASMRQGTYPTISSFGRSSSHIRCKKETT